LSGKCQGISEYLESGHPVDFLVLIVTSTEGSLSVCQQQSNLQRIVLGWQVYKNMFVHEQLGTPGLVVTVYRIWKFYKKTLHCLKKFKLKIYR